MSYIVGDNRDQDTFLPARLDDYVRDDAVVRVVDAFVDRLDVKELGFTRPVPAATGRPGYDPRDLLKLYIWGYWNEVRSSRRLERECLRNVELMWLLRRLAPDFKTIADFRRDNGSGIVAVCRTFVLFCRDQGLFVARLVALDGSKFRAAASRRRIMSRQEVSEEIARIEAQIADYLASLAAADAVEVEEAPRAATLAALATLQQRRQDLDTMAAQLAADGRRTVVEGEAEARAMRVAAGGKPPCYNVQTAVDADTGLILHHDVTTEANDTRLLYPMAKATKEALGAETLMVVADAGFSNGAGAAACEADGITPCVPANRSVNKEGDGTLFDRSAFTYQPETDTYRCPAGRTLNRSRRLGREHSVQYIAQDCSGCPLKSQCTRAARRTLQRHRHEDALERMNARIEGDPGLLRQRRCAAEHPFGTIKRMTAGGRFLTRGLRKVKGEMALSVLVYNLLRAINLVGAPTLIAKLA
jgi:transposase